MGSGYCKIAMWNSLLKKHGNVNLSAPSSIFAIPSVWTELDQIEIVGEWNCFVRFFRENLLGWFEMVIEILCLFFHC